MPVISTIVSLRYAKPSERQLTSMIQSDRLVGMTPSRVNWALGSSIPDSVSDGTITVEMPHVGPYGATVYMTMNDDVVVRAYLVQE